MAGDPQVGAAADGTPPAAYSLAGLAVPESLDLLHDLLDRVRAERPDVDPTALSMFETAVVEIHGNVVKHGRPRGQVVYTFALRIEDDRLVGELVDNGVGSPDLSDLDPLPDAVSESGRGLWLARATVDSLEHTRVGDTNRWVLTRRRTAEASEGPA